MANDVSLNREVKIPSDAATGSLRLPIINARPSGLRRRFRWPTKTSAASPAQRYQKPADDRGCALAATPEGPLVKDAKCSVNPMTTSAYINVTTATANGPSRNAGKA